LSRGKNESRRKIAWEKHRRKKVEVYWEGLQKRGKNFIVNLYRGTLDGKSFRIFQEGSRSRTKGSKRRWGNAPKNPLGSKGKKGDVLKEGGYQMMYMILKPGHK